LFFDISRRGEFPGSRFLIGTTGKNDLYIRVLAAFPGSGWGKLSGEIHLDLKGLACQ
jgi:hypothetical protein